MESWQIRRYTPAMSKQWDAFVKASRNGTFLLERPYIDYHADRFSDCSWMAFKGNRLMALLPANLDADGVLHSHQGLTYGGWILPEGHLDTADLSRIFEKAIDTWKELDIKALYYKPIPYIYATAPAQDDEYALFRLGAKLTDCNVSSTINLSNPIHFNKLQRRHFTKASQLPFLIEESKDARACIALVADCLAERHNATPVHSGDELQLLLDRFPNNIRIFNILLENTIQATVCIYDTGTVAHAQYIATTPPGRELNLLTPLFHRLLTTEFASRRYFDFGISNERDGSLNEGLLRQKASYGASAVSYKRYLLQF